MIALCEAFPALTPASAWRMPADVSFILMARRGERVRRRQQPAARGTTMEELVAYAGRKR